MLSHFSSDGQMPKGQQILGTVCSSARPTSYTYTSWKCHEYQQVLPSGYPFVFPILYVQGDLDFLTCPVLPNISPHAMAEESEFMGGICLSVSSAQCICCCMSVPPLYSEETAYLLGPGFCAKVPATTLTIYCHLK